VQVAAQAVDHKEQRGHDRHFNDADPPGRFDMHGGLLEVPRAAAQAGTMWNEPYLETCCRSALHRLTLVGTGGRPDGLKDGPCLARLGTMGLAVQRADDARWVLTAAGVVRHAGEVLRRA